MKNNTKNNSLLLLITVTVIVFQVLGILGKALAIIIFIILPIALISGVIYDSYLNKKYKK